MPMATKFGRVVTYQTKPILFTLRQCLLTPNFCDRDLFWEALTLKVNA